MWIKKILQHKAFYKKIDIFWYKPILSLGTFFILTYIGLDSLAAIFNPYLINRYNRFGSYNTPTRMKLIEDKEDNKRFLESLDSINKAIETDDANLLQYIFCNFQTFINCNGYLKKQSIYSLLSLPSCTFKISRGSFRKF